MEELNLTSSVVGINLSRTTYESTPFRTYYLIGIPILIATALVAFLVNSYILLSSRWIRKKMSPNLKLSISLAAADAFTSVLMVIGLVINSYLPIALGKPRLELNCLRLFLESLRIGAIETSVIHLLVLSLNQLLSIRYPLHYSRLISARKVHWVILGIWLFPTVAVGLCFSIYGYNATNCWTEAFVELQFRLFVFILVFAPFMLLMIIYILLLISLRQVRWISKIVRFYRHHLIFCRPIVVKRLSKIPWVLTNLNGVFGWQRQHP